MREVVKTNLYLCLLLALTPALSPFERGEGVGGSVEMRPIVLILSLQLSRKQCYAICLSTKTINQRIYKMKNILLFTAVIVTGLLLLAGVQSTTAASCTNQLSLAASCTNNLNLAECTNQLTLNLASCPGCTNNFSALLAECTKGGCTNKLTVDLAECTKGGCTNKFNVVKS